jgi:Protein of unknown function (DUF1350)
MIRSPKKSLAAAALILATTLSSLCQATAFSRSLSFKSRNSSRSLAATTAATNIVRSMTRGGFEDGSGGGGAMELTNALARLDGQWKIQQKQGKQRSRWTILALPQDNNNAAASPPLEQEQQQEQDYVYLLEPPGNTVPSCLLIFVGGAGLGQFPQIAYNEFLLRLSNKLNAAVIAAPYSVGLDHFGLAKQVGELSRRAIIRCQDDPERLYPSNLPTYCIAHSLGCKLASIYMAATDQPYDGVGFMSFNNFGFSQTIRMAKMFAEQIQPNTSTANRPTSSATLLDQVFSVAETIVGSIGVDFSPNPAETERLLTMKYDEDRQSKTRMFVFDDDTLDSTESFVDACQGSGPEVSGLPGTHLTPVYFRLGLEALPEETRDMAREATGGIESASFGNEEELNVLVEELSGWILGKGPSRKPAWQKERPRIAGTANEN